MSNTKQSTDGPDIYVAAREDDVEHMHRALAAGQSLTQQREHDKRTPFHWNVVFGEGKVEFLAAALEIAPEGVWIRDKNYKRPIELAAQVNNEKAFNLVQATMRTLLYPKNEPESP